MLDALRRRLSRSGVFAYNTVNRDQWVARQAVSLPSGSRVLDAGAGPCQYRPLFSHCDYRAQDFAAYAGPEHRYGELDYVGDITALPVPDGAFDAVLCTEVLEHLPRPDLALAEFARVLRPGGRLFLTAPLGSGLHMTPYHFYGGFTPHWYARFLQEHGLRLVSCEANGGFFKLYGQESQRFVGLLAPASAAGRMLFFPLRVILALWFQLALPLLCHWLDRLDRERAFTAGYFVIAEKAIA